MIEIALVLFLELILGMVAYAGFFVTGWIWLAVVIFTVLNLVLVSLAIFAWLNQKSWEMVGKIITNIV